MSSPGVDRTGARRKAVKMMAEKNATIEDGRSKLRFKENVLQTWLHILRIADNLARGGALVETEPGIFRILTNNVALARQCHRSSRTIQRHRRILEDFGLIHDTIDHGYYHDFEILIKAEYLGLAELGSRSDAQRRVREEIAKAEQAEQDPDPFDEIPIADKLSAITSSIVQVNHSNAGVDKMRPQAQVPGYAPAAPWEVQGTQDAAEASGGGPAARSAHEARRSAARQAEKAAGDRALAGTLWLFAKQCLWPGIKPEDEGRAIEAIQKLYGRIDESAQALWHGRFTGMVRLAAEYIERSPTPPARAGGDVAAGSGPRKARFVPQPWVWFDPRNKCGFVGVWPWYEKAEYSRTKAKNENILWRCKGLWDDNLRRPVNKQRDKVRLLADLRERLAATGNQHLQAEFAMHVVDSERRACHG